MDLMTAIKERRSVRKFTPEPVGESDIQTLLEAVRWAPSWANTQVWEVVVVRDDAVKKELSLLLDRNPAQRTTAAAPLVFALAARRNVSGCYNGMTTTDKGDWFMFDMGLATQNLCLAAHSLGLGSVIVGLFDAQKAREILNLPEGYDITALVPVGHPAHKPKPPKRREAQEFTHTNGF